MVYLEIIWNILPEVHSRFCLSFAVVNFLFCGRRLPVVCIALALVYYPNLNEVDLLFIGRVIVDNFVNCPIQVITNLTDE